MDRYLSPPPSGTSRKRGREPESREEGAPPDAAASPDGPPGDRDHLADPPGGPPGPPSDSADESTAAASHKSRLLQKEIKEGMKVFAFWREGRGRDAIIGYYTAKVTAIHVKKRATTYDVEFDDGETLSNVNIGMLKRYSREEEDAALAAGAVDVDNADIAEGGPEGGSSGGASAGAGADPTLPTVSQPADVAGVHLGDSGPGTAAALASASAPIGSSPPVGISPPRRKGPRLVPT